LYYSNYANFSGRGFPDVSAMSVSPYYYGMYFHPGFSDTILMKYLGYYGGKLQRNGGTSAAAPVIAGIIGLINDARLHAGKSSLGFFNPALYSSGYKSFTDITGGRAIGCDGSDTQTGSGVAGAGIIPYAFWTATAGWDPAQPSCVKPLTLQSATGFGVPNFSSLLTYALSI
jgi:tripeptidyl-peptidase-1